MIYSMTGFGKAFLQLPNKKITIEIRSLNSKGLDLSIRMPQTYREKEIEIKNILANYLDRGKIECSIYIEITGEETTTQINAPIVKAYMRQLSEIDPSSHASDLLQMAIRLPEALKTEKADIDENEYAQVLQILHEAIQHINQFRQQEGQQLQADIQLRLNNIKELRQNITQYEPERLQMVKERLQQNLSDLQTTIDQNRFEQELIFYLEKYDINEEKVRLDNHLHYFEQTFLQDDKSGRKLGFIAQEIGREINTIGSKSNHAEMQKMVVQMKDELEKIKEQVLNVL